MHSELGKEIRLSIARMPTLAHTKCVRNKMRPIMDRPSPAGNSILIANAPPTLLQHYS
jgi:hypothetical protein